MADTNDQTLTVEEAAALLKVDPVTVQRELKAERLPGNKVGRAWRIHREDLRAYLKGQQRDPRRAIDYAAYCFNSGDLDSGLVTLVGALGYETMPIELRFALTSRVARLIAARDAVDPAEAVKVAENTRWNLQGDDVFISTQIMAPGFGPHWTVKIPDVWNKMLHEFLFSLRSFQRRVATKLILRWQDNWGNSVTPPPDAADCRKVIEAVVPPGTLVDLVEFDRWTVVRAEGQRVEVGPGPHGPAYDDVRDRVTAALQEARRPREDYATDDDDRE